jgi:hypothetical protein
LEIGREVLPQRRLELRTVKNREWTPEERISFQHRRRRGCGEKEKKLGARSDPELGRRSAEDSRIPGITDATIHPVKIAGRNRWG